MKKTKKCLVIYNPKSGKGLKADKVKEYKQIFEDKGFVADFYATKRAGDAAEQTKKAKGYDIVFAVGGDGTLNEVVRGNYERKEQMIICPVPSGTCNDVATMLGYGIDPMKNIEMALDGKPKSYDIGTVNGIPFVYVLGMGKFMNIPYETKNDEKKKMGYVAYVKDGVIEFTAKLKRYKAEVTLDGEKQKDNYSLIMISNSNHIAGINKFHKDVVLNDGKFEVLLCKASKKRYLIINFVKFLLGIKNKMISVKASNIKIKLNAKPDKKWCIDGEKFDYDGKEYKIKVACQMKFLVPKEMAKTDLFK
jgi:diacylglycerol kinase (ATP)